MKIEIKVFEPGYDKREFYGYMGDPLTMPDVRREIPYLTNARDMVWFLAVNGDELVGFAALLPDKKKVALRNHYVYPARRGSGIFRRLLQASLDYAERKGLPIVVAIKGDTLLKTYQNLGFGEERRTRNYVFLRREP